VERIPSVKIEQPRIEQVHTYLDLILKEVRAAKPYVSHTCANKTEKHWDEVEYLVRSVRQILPARQTPLPF